MSTDENCDENISLNERAYVSKTFAGGARAKTAITKQPKQNTRKKYQKQCFKGHLATTKSPVKDKWMIPETPNPYSIGRKKRQNGDKGEPLAHSKRTCPSDHYSPLNRRKNNYIEKGVNSKRGSKSANAVSNKYLASGKLSMEPHTSYEDVPRRESLHDLAFSLGSEHDRATPSSSSASSSSYNNHGGCYSKPTVYDGPSSSKHGLNGYKENEPPSSVGQSNSLGVSFIDSESDSSAPHNSYTQFKPLRKVSAAGLKKVLESDDDDDSDSSWRQNNYRKGVPLISSCSDESSDIPVVTKKSHKKRLSVRLSSTDSNEDDDDCFPSNYASYSHPHTFNTSKKSSSGRSSVSSRSKSNYDHSYSSRNRDLTNSSSVSSSTSLSSQSTSSSSTTTSNSSPVRNTRYPHRGLVRQQSPPPLRTSRRCLRGISRSAMSHMGNLSFGPTRPTLDFAERYPDVFDPEESSDMEFFTANSYSDTEASLSNMDSVFVNDVSATTSSRRYAGNNTFSISGSSPSEDEISVIFTTGTAFGETNNRRIRHRGTGGRRRRNRGSGRSGSALNTQEGISVSPDPVAQVRQVEEDEQLARRLQAEFDAEARREEVPPVSVSSRHSDDSELDFELPDDLPEDESSQWNDSSINISPFPRVRSTVFRSNSSRQSPVISRYASNIVFLGGASGGRRRRGRRIVHPGPGPDPWMFQFARILGLSQAYASPEESDYETLLQFADSVGGDVPRGLRKTEIGRLPTRTFYFPGAGPSTSRANEDIVHKRTELNKECQVCLSDYENGDILRILPCFHEFHTPCIDPWLKINHTCPVCRVEVTFDH